jgi:lysozyme family protein
MDTSFNDALACVLQFEGGYSNNPDDSGGSTMKGITQKTYDAYRQGKSLLIKDVQDISDIEVKDIYFYFYWQPAHCTQLPARLDAIHFDTAVNSGVAQAAKLLQQAVGAKVDGVIGPMTLTLALSRDINSSIKNYVKARTNFYVNLVIKNSNQLQFLKSWLNRTLSFI